MRQLICLTGWQWMLDTLIAAHQARFLLKHSQASQTWPT